MPTITRRRFIQAAASLPLLGLCGCAGRGRRAALAAGDPRSRAVKLEDLSHEYEDYRYRTPIKFGGSEVDRVTLLNVKCVVSTRDGRTAKGFGSMPLGNVWSFPSREMS